ncbi:MAG: hypothetical protein Q4B14_05870 [Clostridia bacterium]|nr:hypothetical protein [Clostridia bacterium]
MFRKSNLPVCPYCNKRLSFTRAWFVHRKGEYVCPECECISSITYKRTLKLYAFLAILISGTILASTFVFKTANIYEFLLCVLIFLAFYVNVPYVMVLEVKSQNVMDDYYNKKRNYYKEEKKENLKIYDVKKKKGKNIYDNPLEYDDIEKTRVF